MATNDLFLFNEDSAQRTANAVRQVEANPPLKKTEKRSRDRRSQLVAKISAKGSSSGYYDAVQVAWNGSAWATVSGGLTWDGGVNLPELYEINGETLIEDLIDMSVDIFVFPYLIGATDGTFQWVFDWVYPYAFKVSNDDTTPSHLTDKIKDYQGNPIGTVANPGGNEEWWLPQLGDVTGPASSYDTEIARFDGVTGKIIEGSKGRISDTGVFQLVSADASNYISLEHDNANALFKWDDGDLVFETQKGTNEPTVLKIVGHGTGIGELQVHDEDSGEYLDLSAAAGVGGIQVLGSSPAGLSLQPDGLCDLSIFSACTASNYPGINLSGRDSGNALRTAVIKIDNTEVDTLLISNVALTRFATNVNMTGEVRIGDAYDMPSSDGNADQVLKTDGSDTVSWVDAVLTDENVKVSANDTIAKYLIEKLANGDAISVTEINDGGDEDAKISVVIHSVTEETVVAANDEALIYDAGGAVIRRMTVANFIIGYLKLLTGYDAGEIQVFGHDTTPTFEWYNASTWP